MISAVLKKVFGSKHDREIKRMRPIVAQINARDEEYKKLSDDQLRAKTGEFRERLQKGETVDDLLVEAFAAVKNACRRMCGTDISVTGNLIRWEMVPYDVQLMGGMVLHNGNIAELQTGEGKTLVATLPLYLNGLTGKNCQLVTVNDYLARRDSEWCGSVLRWLGLTVGCIQNDMTPDQRRQQYACDVTYGTNSEFGFDYLRDMGMANDPASLVQRDYFFAIIDEVDSILIDEARTPLIISGPAATSTHRYDQLKPAVEELFRKQNALCTRFMAEAKATLENTSATKEEQDEAIGKLFRVKLGMPKHKQFMRMLEDAELHRRVDKYDSLAHSDQNRGVIQEIKDSLYFTMDERQHEADLSEMGRKALRPDDPESFVLPDLVTQFQQIEKREDLTPEQKQALRTQSHTLFTERSETIQNIAQLLRAYCLYEKDVQYVVDEAGKVIIVDEFTGRPMPGRRFSDGLHQALEAKEEVTIERETQTLATVTIQNYFRLYAKLAGMTGTAETEAQEFRDIYGLDVVVIPTNRPCVRKDTNDLIFKTKREKYNAIVAEVKECYERGQPVLLGTISVSVSEVLSRMLRREKVVHSVLNAKQHQLEAQIVANAGARSAVTIATNMAGRGTDIRLGQGVAELGGLHVIASERHDARRIDRQLRGRCARQGDPGSSRFYVSLEDDLMRLFGSERIAKLIDRLGYQEGEEMSHSWLNSTIETAQRKVEQHHYSIRKRTLQFDDVMNKQREVIYGRRGEVLRHTNPRDLIFDYLHTVIYERLQQYETSIKETGYPFNRKAMLDWLNLTFPIGFIDQELDVTVGSYDLNDLTRKLGLRVEEIYELKCKSEVQEVLPRLERYVMLEAHDRLWQEHLLDMDNLRQGVTLAAHAQKDPLVEYKKEAFALFNVLVARINEEIVGNLFRWTTRAQLDFRSLLASLPQQEVHEELGQFAGTGVAADTSAPAAEEVAMTGGTTVTGNGGQTASVTQSVTVSGASSDDGTGAAPAPAGEPPPKPKGVTFRRAGPKVGDNDPCPCNSGKKYKKCCGRYSQ